MGLGRVPGLAASHSDDCLLVAVDGYDGAGKTTFADAWGEQLRAAGRDVVRVSIDDFQNPAAVRHARGRQSPEGFWLDSYDYAAFRRDVLRPLGSGGSRWFRPASHDLASDQLVSPPLRQAPAGAVVLVDGIFLHRDELVGAWDVSVWLEVPVAVAVARMAARDGSPDDPSDPALRRYVEGQQLYAAACDPRARATRVIANA